MKTSARISIALLMVCTLPAAIGSMNLISTALEIHGDWSESWVIGDEETGEFHNSSGTFSTLAYGIGASASIDTSSLQGWESASSSINAFSLIMSSSSKPRAHEIPGGMGGLPGQEINIYSTATTRLNFEGTRLSVNISGVAGYNYDDEQDMQVVLRNVTSGVTLLDVSNLDRYSDVPFAYDYFYEVNPSEEFELVLSGYINSWDAKITDMNTSVAMFSVNDAGSTFALSALAFLGISGALRLTRRKT